MTYKFSARSRQRLEGVHPDLIAVMELAISRTPIDFTVLEGIRSRDRQRKLVNSGASQTMNSRHLTGHAVDVAPLLGGTVSWDWPLYHKIAPVIKQAAEDLGIEIEWGGDWRSFRDGPHWQLPWDEYAADDRDPRIRQMPSPDAPPATEIPEQGARASLVAAILKIFDAMRAKK